MTRHQAIHPPALALSATSKGKQGGGGGGGALCVKIMELLFAARQADINLRYEGCFGLRRNDGGLLLYFGPHTDVQEGLISFRVQKNGPDDVARLTLLVGARHPSHLEIEVPVTCDA